MIKRKQKIKKIFLILLLFLGSREIIFTASVFTDKKELARQALARKDYPQVVAICQQELKKNPQGYDFNFLLAQAEAFQGHWERAQEIIDQLLSLYPQNLDLLLFRSRLLGWKGDFDAARQSFEKILTFDSNNIEAHLGLMDLAWWQHQEEQALCIGQKILALNPQEARVYFRIGKIYYRQGRFDEARQYFQQAINYDPNNQDYRQYLQLTQAHFKAIYEIRYSLEIISFDDQRTPYQTHDLTLEIGLPQKKGSLLVSGQRTRRFAQDDSRAGAELFYSFSPSTYTNLSFQIGSPANLFPQSTFHIEIYQSLLRQGEVSLGFRQYNFKSQHNRIYTGSAGLYWGKLFSFLRWFYNPTANNASWALLGQTRLYYSNENYLFAGLGQGARPFELATFEDLLPQESTLFFGGINWIFAQQWHLKGQFTSRHDKGSANRFTVFFSLGYRF